MNEHTFTYVLYEWLENNRIRLKMQTYAKYHQIIEQHIVPTLGALPIEDVTAATVNQFLYQKSQQGKPANGGALSASSIRTIAFIIKSVLVYAEQKYDCKLLRGKICVPAKEKKQLQVLTGAEQQRLEQACFAYGTDKDLGILLSLYTGLRLGEVCGLAWQDIDRTTCTMYIRHTVERVKLPQSQSDTAKTNLLLLDTKTISSNRIIPFPELLLQAMPHNTTGFVLPGKCHEYIDPRTLQYFFQKRLQQCGIRSINYHALRHTFATRCVESGMDMKSLSEILGHADVAITMNIYVHSSIEHKRKQLEHMAAQHGSYLQYEKCE